LPHCSMCLGNPKNKVLSKVQVYKNIFPVFSYIVLFPKQPRLANAVVSASYRNFIKFGSGHIKSPVFYFIKKWLIRCDSPHNTAEHIVRTKAYFRQCATVTACPFSVVPPHIFISIYLAKIRSAIIPQNTVSAVWNVLPLCRRININVTNATTFPISDQKTRTKRLNTLSYFSTGCSPGLDIVRLLNNRNS